MLPNKTPQQVINSKAFPENVADYLWFCDWLDGVDMFILSLEGKFRGMVRFRHSPFKKHNADILQWVRVPGGISYFSECTYPRGAVLYGFETEEEYNISDLMELVERMAEDILKIAEYEETVTEQTVQEILKREYRGSSSS